MEIKPKNYIQIPFRDSWLQIDQDRFAHYAETPNYMIQCGDYLSSNLANYAEYSPLYYFYHYYEKSFEPIASGPLGAPSATRLSEVVTVLPMSPKAPDIVRHLYTGEPVDKITVVKLKSNGEANSTATTSTFEKCFLTYFSPFHELIVMGFRTLKWSFKTTETNQEGEDKGNSEADYDLESWEE